jgi:hypothetical protein
MDKKISSRMLVLYSIICVNAPIILCYEPMIVWLLLVIMHSVTIVIAYNVPFLITSHLISF